MKQISIIALLVISYSSHSKSIAISFDDSPRGDSLFFKANDRTNFLISALKKSGVKQAIFFSNTQHLHKNNRRNRLKSYADSGHLIANHSHSHQSPEKMSINNYLADITKAHDILKDFPKFTPLYRAPFLNYGKSQEYSDKINQHLKELNYKIGYVTIDNADWYMDSLLQKAIKENKYVNIENLKKAYAEIIWDSIKFYDDLAIKVIGRSPAHILLLHENDLAALCIEELIVHIKSKGWKIVSPTEAYQDPLAERLTTTLKNGDGRIAAIAHELNYNGLKRDKYQNKSEVDIKFKTLRIFE
jgi:peptidoglycan/xylan/chitin deacetylase (PgdA/CDA1 family)